MELVNDFEVKRPIGETWEVLTDVERIAPCLPGAQLQEIEGDEYRGVVKVKVGPITANYKGAATFVEKDDENYRAVLKADGRDSRGQGNANALITAQLTETDGTTHVTVVTDLKVTGKVAQFGRGVMADVSKKLLGQFVENLETTVLAEGSAAAAAAVAAEAVAASDEAGADTVADGADNGAAATASSASAAAEPATEAPRIRKIDAPEAAPVDLLDATGAPVAKRLAPVVGLLLLLLIIRRLLSNND